MSEIKQFTQVTHDQRYANINEVGWHKEDQNDTMWKAIIVHDTYNSTIDLPYHIILLYVHFNNMCNTPCGDHSGKFTFCCWSPGDAQCPHQTYQRKFECMHTLLGVLCASW